MARSFLFDKSHRGCRLGIVAGLGACALSLFALHAVGPATIVAQVPELATATATSVMAGLAVIGLIALPLLFRATRQNHIGRAHV